jgi:hypothetical protein
VRSASVVLCCVEVIAYRSARRCLKVFSSRCRLIQQLEAVLCSYCFIAFVDSRLLRIMVYGLFMRALSDAQRSSRT